MPGVSRLSFKWFCNSSSSIHRFFSLSIRILSILKQDSTALLIVIARETFADHMSTDSSPDIRVYPPHLIMISSVLQGVGAQEVVRFPSHSTVSPASSMTHDAPFIMNLHISHRSKAHPPRLLPRSTTRGRHPACLSLAGCQVEGGGSNTRNGDLENFG